MKNLQRISAIVAMSLFAVLGIQAAEPVRIATSQPLSGPFVLEGMAHDGPGGRTWVRPEDVAPVYLAALTKAVQPGVRFGAENAGLRWKTVVKAEGKDSFHR